MQQTQPWPHVIAITRRGADDDKATWPCQLPFWKVSSGQGTLWLVGLPRRKSSLSMEGRSSWMSDMVCSISMAQAVGMACAMLPPTASHAASARHGRTRLPPASREYLRGRHNMTFTYTRTCQRPIPVSHNRHFSSTYHLHSVTARVVSKRDSSLCHCLGQPRSQLCRLCS